MKVKLLNKPTLEFADSAIGQCYNAGPYKDLEKQAKRIHKVACVSKHSSTIEFIDYVFEIEASTKVLLEMTRHRMASYGCQSSRYTLDKGEFFFEKTGDNEVDLQLSKWKEIIEDMISLGKKNDVVSLMLPQAYRYKWTVKFNARSLQNFFELRRARTAHYQIKEIAEEMYKLIPDDHKFLFE
jgi:thymidylate synthase (FAD)